MTIKILRRLQPTTWLAERLHLSTTTIERLRMIDPDSLPPCIHIGRSVRYDELAVEEWLRERMRPQPSAVDPNPPQKEESHHA
ncbi:helix-turn-helix transcriptional regulator [Extensimonas sp. H3M7-6]|jgi:predicted DNA-binding transcriptional regulator AlpA|uniref:helix-turn-helix transcriptional regulator n=1 Tax=Extensimonas soli TaxID=3031322 RepID=UPI0023D9B1C7|nr:helix-turn-helix domain-containing protein [Extensimonas sp. H3M7-6]MDF1481084.1 helix-turn-helix domain-containing protein [Extensimonas sp. H3M7-6]